jgi:hypothetical protein
MDENCKFNNNLLSKYDKEGKKTYLMNKILK